MSASMPQCMVGEMVSPFSCETVFVVAGLIFAMATVLALTIFFWKLK